MERSKNRSATLKVRLLVEQKIDTITVNAHKKDKK